MKIHYRKLSYILLTREDGLWYAPAHTGIMRSYIDAFINAGLYEDRGTRAWTDSDIREDVQHDHYVGASDLVWQWIEVNEPGDVEDQLEEQRWDDYSDYINDGGWSSEGPVEGVDSHAYYGPMTTLTNFIEAERDREFD